MVEVQQDKLNLLETVSDWIIECQDKDIFAFALTPQRTEEGVHYIY